MWIIYLEIKMGHTCLKRKTGTKVEAEDVEGDKCITAQTDMVISQVITNFNPIDLSCLESKLISFSQAMELNTPTMVSNHQSRHQALECLMEHEDLPWAGDGLWRRFDIDGRIILLI